MTPANVKDGVPLPQRSFAILTIALGIIMSVIDGAIANVALPTIAEDLRATPSFSIWVVNGYQLAITISLLPLASLGEIAGYRRIYLAGLALFTTASLLCALSHSLITLAAARALQGFGAAGIMSVNTALVRFIYPSSMLGRGIGINALIVAFSAAVGPTLAAGILSMAPWPWLFAVNLPFGIAAVLIGRRALPKTPRSKHCFDWSSALLSALTFGFGITAIDSFGHGAHSAVYLGELACAVAAGIVLVRGQLRTTAPLLPVDLLRIPIFALSVSTSVASFCAQMMAFVAIPFFLHMHFAYSAVEIGLLITPWPIAIIFAAPVAGRLADRFPAGLLGGGGLLVFAAGLVSLASLPAHPAVWDLIWRMALSGAGFGFFQSPNNRTMIAAAPRERSGGASGMLGTARLLGQTTGAALVALFLAQYPATGTDVALWVGATFAIVGAALSMLRLTPAGARGAQSVQIAQDQRVKGDG